MQPCLDGPLGNFENDLAVLLSSGFRAATVPVYDLPVIAGEIDAIQEMDKSLKEIRQLLTKLKALINTAVSDVPGTTTDLIEKPMELLPLGPVLFIDTAGIVRPSSDW
jgi:hypothetical protein